MKNILVIYYTQTGQLKAILDNILMDVKSTDEITVDYLKIQPENDFPYPWGNEPFFDCFPESVKGIPTSLKATDIDPSKSYDLIILGYQPWYLSPSIPTTSFLLSAEAKILMSDKPVITVIGARNMWTQSQEIIKYYLNNLGAILVGNIVLADRTDNYIAGITVIQWLIHGKKGPSKFLPEAGVSKTDIKNSQKFGTVIRQFIQKDNYQNMQTELLKIDAVKVKYHLCNIERNARQIFDIFADYVLKKASRGEKSRKAAIKLFKYYLLFVFFILSPIFSFIFMVQRVILYPVANRDIRYFKGVTTR